MDYVYIILNRKWLWSLLFSVDGVYVLTRVLLCFQSSIASPLTLLGYRNFGSGVDIRNIYGAHC